MGLLTYRSSTAIFLENGTSMHKQLGFRLGFGLAGIVALGIAGCGNSVRPMTIASNAGTKAVEKYDANHDGVLSYDELRGAPGLRAAVPKIKKLSKPHNPPPAESELWNEKISAEDIDARIREWKDSGAGRVLIKCRVTRRGAPLAGAEVKFVPEDFLGPGLITASGTTDGGGNVVIAYPDDKVRGISPGFYRVEIVKGDEIPAKYNGGTILGQEVAKDADGISSMLVYDLDY
jgi:hypothetical protein